MNFSPFPDLHSKRLHLRALRKTDVAALSVLRSDQAVNRFVDRPKTCSPAEAEVFIQKIQQNVYENRSVYWALADAENGDLIGTICFWNFSQNNTRAAIGYELLPAWQGRGLMQEALTEVLNYGFSVIRLALIVAFSADGNVKSVGLLRRNDFLPDTEHLMAGPEESAGYDVFFLRNSPVK